MPTEVTAGKIKQVCDGVWRDRAAILKTKAAASGEEALVGTAYWRLCNAGRKPGSSIADCAPYLRELIRRYRAEGPRPVSHAPPRLSREGYEAAD